MSEREEYTSLSCKCLGGKAKSNALDRDWPLTESLPVSTQDWTIPTSPPHATTSRLYIPNKVFLQDQAAHATIVRMPASCATGAKSKDVLGGPCCWPGFLPSYSFLFSLSLHTCLLARAATLHTFTTKSTIACCALFLHLYSLPANAFFTADLSIIKTSSLCDVLFRSLVAKSQLRHLYPDTCFVTRERSELRLPDR